MAFDRQHDGGGATERLSARILATQYEKLPEDVQRVALHCIADWYAVTLAAIGQPELVPLLEDVREEGGSPLATAAGMANKTSPYAAALVNGTTSHLLDFDDVNTALPGHPTAVIFPALLALAEARSIDGHTLLSAFVAGYETACRIGRVLGDGHYERGYHSTFSVGVLGTAAACARLLNLNVDQTSVALGLAATQAAGLKAQFGTMAKPLHAGLAARNGLMAARLASRGFNGGTNILEQPQGGYSTVMSAAADWGKLDDDPPAGWYLLNRLFKYHAACYGINAGLECARELRASGISPEQISAITVVTHPSTREMCHIAQPTSAAEARFSLRLNVALALHGVDTSDIAAYRPERLSDPAITHLRDMIKAEFREALGRMETHMTIKLNDGSVHQWQHDSNVPQHDIGKEAIDIRRKFETLAGSVLGPPIALDLWQTIERAASLHDISPLAAPLAHST